MHQQSTLECPAWGYTDFLRLCPNGINRGYGTHLSFKVLLKDRHRSEHPFSLTITIELLNQQRDQDHITRVLTYELFFKKLFKNFGFPEYGMPDNQLFPLADLELNEDGQTQYLKDDCLKFRVLKQEITFWRKNSQP